MEAVRAHGWILNQEDFSKELLLFEKDLLQGWHVQENVREDRILARASMLIYLQEMLPLIEGGDKICRIVAARPRNPEPTRSPGFGPSKAGRILETEPQTATARQQTQKKLQELRGDLQRMREDRQSRLREHEAHGRRYRNVSFR